MTTWSDRTTYHGKRVNQGTAQIMRAANKMVRTKSFGSETSDITMTQGGYNKGGVSASAGTHDGGGAFDLTSFNWRNREKVFRILGTTLSLRRASEGPWPEHMHGIVCGDGTASSGAKYQVGAYYAGLNGLANRNSDRGWRPSKLPILFRLDGDLRDRYCRVACHLYDEPAATKQRQSVAVGDKITDIVAVVNVDGHYWFVTADGRCGYEDNFAITPPDVAEPTPIPEPVYDLEPLDAEWEVTHGPKWGLSGPHGDRLYERAAGYHLYTEDTTVIDGHRWYITAYGTWYDDTHLVPWTTPTPAPTPEPEPSVTVWDHAHWNVASAKPGWFSVPWSQRGDDIAALLRDLACSVITCNETHYSYMTADILKALGDQYTHVSSPIGNDLFFDHEKWKQTRPYAEYDLKAQNRRAGVLHLRRIATGQDATIVNTHFPYASASLRTVASRNLVKLLAQVDGPIFLTGDFNNQAFSSSTPHKILRDAGFKFLREQATVVNGSKPEYPGKGQWLSDITTKPSQIKLTGGLLTLSSSRLSDHRPVKVRGQID